MSHPDAPIEPNVQADPGAPQISLGTLFALFLKSGLAFGGGIGITALLQADLVEKRHALSRAEFLAIYGLGRVVPSGTVTALAVAYGYRYQGFFGTLATLVAMIVPSFVLTILLTIAYTMLVGSPAFAVVNLTLMPAALAVIIVAALRLGQEFFHPSVELLLALGAFLGVILFGISPSLLLVAGGIVGAVTIRDRQREKRA